MVIPNVTKDDTRDHHPTKCFYCNSHLGNPHEFECVVPTRKVKVKVIIDLVVDEPISWDKYDIESHLNESSWCADNILDKIEEYKENGRCICNITKIEYVGELENGN